MRWHILPDTCLNPLSGFILRSSFALSALMLLIARIFTYAASHADHLNPLLFACMRVYPLLTLVVLAVSVSGALLIDIYDKTRQS